MDIAPINEDSIPFASIADIYSTVKVDDIINTSGTSNSPEHVRRTIDTQRAQLEAFVEMLKTGVVPADAMLADTGALKNGIRWVERSNSRSHQAIVDKLAQELGYKGELEATGAYKPHDVITSYQELPSSPGQIDFSVTQYQPLPRSPKVVDKQGATWQLTRYMTRGSSQDRNYTGIAMIRMPSGK